MLIRYLVRRRLREKLIIRINPRCVFFHIGTNQPLTFRIKQRVDAIESRFPVASMGTRFVNKCLYSAEPFLLQQSVFADARPIEQESRYKLLEDVVVHRNRVDQSEWFQMLMRELEDTGLARHKLLTFRSREDIIKFLESYVIGLIKTLESTGYDETISADTGTAFIDREGRLMKSDQGNHRFAAARILGVPEVPLEILGVHEAFFKQVTGKKGFSELCTLLQKVEAEHRDCSEVFGS